MVKGLPVFVVLGFATLGFGQGTPWTPPKTSLPNEFVRAVQFLHEHGLGDPRGGEYRKVKVPLGRLTDSKDASYNEIRGWVLPAKKGEPRRVVSLSGLIIPVKEVGEKADIDQDMMRPHEVAPNQSVPVIAGLLLIRGETARAERLHSAYPDNLFSHYNFSGLAFSFLYDWWSQAVYAHSYGDPHGTLQVVTEIAKHRDAYETEVRRVVGEEEFKRVQKINIEAGKPPVYFSGIGNVDALLADVQRRVQNESKQKDLEAIRKLPPSQRIEALIDALDRAGAMFMDETPYYSYDPIVKALIDEGEPALPALFVAAENDRRLTRAVGDGGIIFSDRIIYPVSAAATDAIRNILQSRSVNDLSKLKALWEQTRQLGQARRNLIVLQDSAAGWQRWYEATEGLFSGKAPFQAEALRPSFKEQLTEALRARTLQLASPSLPDWQVRAAFTMVRGLALWDAEAAGPVGDEVIRVATERVRKNPGDLDTFDGVLGEAVVALVEAGHKKSLVDYLALLDEQKAGGHFDWETKRFFSPLIQFRDEPSVQAATQRLFLSDGSPWNLAHNAKEGFGALQALIGSPLRGVGPVQEGLLKVLDDQTILGEVEVLQPTMLSVISKNGRTVASFPVAAGEKLPSPGERVPLRVADSVMVDLSRLRGAPVFVPTWPTPQRDQAIERMKRFLRANASNLVSLVPANS